MLASCSIPKSCALFQMHRVSSASTAKRPTASRAKRPTAATKSKGPVDKQLSAPSVASGSGDVDAADGEDTTADGAAPAAADPAAADGEDAADDGVPPLRAAIDGGVAAWDTDDRVSVDLPRESSPRSMTSGRTTPDTSGRRESKAAPATRRVSKVKPDPGRLSLAARQTRDAAASARSWRRAARRSRTSASRSARRGATRRRRRRSRGCSGSSRS